MVRMTPLIRNMKNMIKNMCSKYFCLEIRLFVIRITYILPFFRHNAGPGDPYIKFFKTKTDRAAIWKTLPPLKLEEMNLTQKAKAITEMVT